MKTKIEELVRKWKTQPLYQTADFLSARFELEALLKEEEAPVPEPEPEEEHPEEAEQPKRRGRK